MSNKLLFSLILSLIGILIYVMPTVFPRMVPLLLSFGDEVTKPKYIRIIGITVICIAILVFLLVEVPDA